MTLYYCRITNQNQRQGKGNQQLSHVVMVALIVILMALMTLMNSMTLMALMAT